MSQSSALFYYVSWLLGSDAVQNKQAEAETSATKKSVQLKTAQKQIEKLKKDIAKSGQSHSCCCTYASSSVDSVSLGSHLQSLNLTS